MNCQVEQIVDFLMTKRFIKGEDKEIYHFAFKQGFRIILNVTTTLLIGYALGMPWQSILFLFSFIPIRSYAGGFHAATPSRCYIYSICIIIAVLTCIDFLRGYIIVQAVITAVSGFSIYSLAPIESCNKPLKVNERTEYRQKTLKWLLILMTGIVVIAGINQEFSLCLTAALSVSAILLLLEKVKTIRYMKL